MIPLSSYLTLGAILFSISIVGIFLNRKNVIIVLMAIELMLLAVNLNFIAFSYFMQDIAGQVFVFFILTVAAAEAALSGWIELGGHGRAKYLYALARQIQKRSRHFAVLESLDNAGRKEFLQGLEDILDRFNCSGDQTLMVGADYLEVVIDR